MGQLLLGQIVKSIGLILCCCGRILNGIPAIGQVFNLCIMTGCNIVCSDIKTALQQRFPFYIAVTGNTGIGCTAF